MNNFCSLTGGVRVAILTLIFTVTAVFMTGCGGLPTYGSSDPNRPNYMKWQAANQVTFQNETAGLVKIYNLRHEEIEQVAPHSTVTISVNMQYYEGWAEHAFVARCYTLDTPPAQVGKEAIVRTTVSNADNGYGMQTPRVNIIRLYNSDFAISRW